MDFLKPFPACEATADGMKELHHAPAKSVTVTPNVEYSERDGKKLHLQILHPMGFPPEKLPLIVYVQGSGWHKQQVFVNLPQLARFALRGFVVAIVEYRESEIAPFPAQTQDCKTAVRFMRANAERFGIDVNNVALWGDSSGGHTVLMSGITGDAYPDTDDYGEFSCAVNSIVDFFGPTDVIKMSDFPSVIDHIGSDSPEGLLLGGVTVTKHPELSERANPSAYVSSEKPCPPVLIIHGNRDRIVPFEQSIIIYEALKAAGKTAEFYKMVDADHGGGEFWCDDTFDLIENFIRRYNK